MTALSPGLRQKIWGQGQPELRSRTVCLKTINKILYSVYTAVRIMNKVGMERWVENTGGSELRDSSTHGHWHLWRYWYQSPQVLTGSSTNSWIISGLLCPVDPHLTSPFNFSFDKLFGISVCHSLHLNRECGEPMEWPWEMVREYTHTGSRARHTGANLLMCAGNYCC